MTKFNPKKFCLAIIECIKNKIKVQNDNFESYSYYATRSTDIQNLIDILLSKKYLNDFLLKAEIKQNKIIQIQANRCLIVITYALLKCSNYNELKNSICELTGLNKRYVYDIIKKYIPILKLINPASDISKWLPHKAFEYNYIKIENMINKRDWIILYPKTQEEFNKLRNELKTNPARLPLKIKCNKGHIFQSNAFNLQRRKRGCRKCANEDLIKYNIDIIKKMVVKKGWILKYPKNQDQLNFLTKKLMCAPNIAPLYIQCKESHDIFTNAHRINQKIRNETKGCLKCSHIKKITYNLMLINKMIKLNDGIICYPKTKEEFNDLKKKHNCKPFKVPLKIKCIKEHLFMSNASLIQQKHWCPHCRHIKVSIGNLCHPIFEYLTIKYLKLKNCQVDFEFSVSAISKHQVDILIKRNDNFIENIEKYQNIVFFPDHINEIAIDFTISIENKFIKEKFYKNYQNGNRFLIIVLLDKYKKKKEIENIIQISKDIKFKNNIQVLNFTDYLQFLYLILDIFNWKPLTNGEKVFISKFNTIYKLTTESFYFDEKYKELIYINKKVKNLLRNLS